MSYQYQDLINDLETEKVIQLMSKLGADKYIEKGNAIIFPTICHNTEVDNASMKLYYYTDNKFFYCYTECGPMSIFNLLKNYYDSRQYEYNWYEDILKVVEDCSSFSLIDNFEFFKPMRLKDKYGEKREQIRLTPIPKGILNVFSKEYPVEWLNDGITKTTMDKYNIMYSISQNKIIIPHYDIDDNLIGIRGRALNDWEVENIGKYMPVKIEGKWYNHRLSLNLYGLNKTLENIKRRKYVYLFESEKSVLQMESFKQDNCAVAVCGSSFNKYQLNLLLKYCFPKEIIICFDKEELPHEDKYFNKLWNIGKKYQNYCDFSFIYDREGLLDMKDSPSDKGEEIFEKLKNRRVHIK